MYKEAKMVLVSRIDYPGVRQSDFAHLPTNGTYIRDWSGNVLWRNSFKDKGIYFTAECDGEKFSGNIMDKVLCERIPEYFEKYYGKYYTNCAAMTHFLTTGEFIECKEGDGMAVIHQGMRPFSMAGKVDVGDMLCIVYGDKRVARSRKVPKFRGRYVDAQKQRRQHGSFTSSVPMKERSFSPKEIRAACEIGSAQGFHFMVCVAHFQGKPVWLSQQGRMPPGDQGVVVILTLGEYDPYQEHDALFTFIKKRR